MKFLSPPRIKGLKVLSIQAQDRYFLRTAVHQSGKQTVNCDGKTSDGIRNVAFVIICIEMVFK